MMPVGPPAAADAGTEAAAVAAACCAAAVAALGHNNQVSPTAHERQPDCLPPSQQIFSALINKHTLLTRHQLLQYTF